MWEMHIINTLPNDYIVPFLYKNHMIIVTKGVVFFLNLYIKVTTSFNIMSQMFPISSAFYNFITCIGVDILRKSD